MLPPPTDFRAELAALRAEVAEIRRAQDERWLDESRAEQVRSIVRDVLADTGTRSMWNGEGGGVSVGVVPGAAAGSPIWRSPYGFGGRITDAGGGWTLQVAVTELVRFVYANASGDGAGGVDDNTRWGVENRRINLIMAGTLVDPSWSYLMMFQYDSQPDRWSDAVDTFTPVYAWVARELGQGWSLMLGNQNIPWDAQSTYLEACTLTAGDYSIFNYRFGVGREVGATLACERDAFRVRAGAFSQLGATSNQWDAATNLSYALAGRAELKWGDAAWDSLEVESSFRASPACVVAGIAGAMSEGRAQNPASPPTPSAQGVTADVSARLSGLTLQLQGAYMRDAAGAPELEWSPGAAAQVAWFIADQVEAFAQACWMGTSDVPWITQFGTSWYLQGPRLKLTTKVFVPFGSGNVNGIGQLSGGLGISAASNNASLLMQVQVMW